jgi:hypothetical protein
MCNQKGIMTKHRVHTAILWILALITVLINLEPAIKYGAIGQIPEITLSYKSPPAWAFTALGFTSIAAIAFVVMSLKIKKWAVISLIGLIPIQSFLLFVCTWKQILMPSLYASITISFVLFNFFFQRHKAKCQPENT